MKMSKETLSLSAVIFDEIKHMYTLNGKVLSGVTAIVKWMFPETYKDIPQSVLEKAAAHGSLVHKKCEQFDNCGFGDDIQEVKDYAALKEKYGLRTLRNEYLVSDNAAIASSIDIVFDADKNGSFPLADIKTTSKIHKDNVSLQLSIYAYLFELCNEGLQAGSLYVIWLPKPQYGAAELMELQRIGSEDCKHIIQAYLDGEDATPYRERFFGNCDTSDVALLEEELPSTLRDAEMEIIRIKTELKEMEAKKKQLEEGLYDLMVKGGVKTWTSERLRITRKLESTRDSIDTAKVKKKYPEVYEDCLKVSKVKGSITINIL